MKSIIEYKIEKIKDKKRKDLATFCLKRMLGAKELAEKARAKGGLAILTAYHFEAKLPVYKKVIEEIYSEETKYKDKIKSMYMEKVSRLNQISSFNQKRIQELTGEIEVLGEVLVEAK